MTAFSITMVVIVGVFAFVTGRFSATAWYVPGALTHKHRDETGTARDGDIESLVARTRDGAAAAAELNERLARAADSPGPRVTRRFIAAGYKP